MVDKPKQGASDSRGAEWLPITQYSARIGGIIYRNVERPIIINGQPALTLRRNVETGKLGVSFELSTQDGKPIAKIEHNKVKDLAKGYVNLNGLWGQSIVAESDGWVWYDLRESPVNSTCEIDCSCLLFGPNGYPLLLHPDRTCIGSPHENNPPGISGVTLQGELRPDLTAISCPGGGRRYLVGIATENFAIGIDITYPTESNEI